MVAAPLQLHLAAQAPWDTPLAEALTARGFTVGPAPGEASEAAGAPVPDALVYLAPRPDTDRVEDLTGFVTGGVTGFVAAAQVAARAMARERRPGSLVAICDIAGVPGRQGRAAEATLSGALIGAVKCLAKELGRSRIAVNAVCHGFVPELGSSDRLSRAEQRLFDMMQLGREGTLQHVVENVAHLARGRHLMTGQVLHVDHGLIM